MRLAVFGIALFVLSGCDTGNSGCPVGTLQTTDVLIGNGRAVVMTDAVRVDYVGRLENGNIFDQGNDVEFRLDGVIAGFRDGLVGMQMGGRREIVIPPELAYGETGIPGVIPACETLTFDVTLITIIE